MTKVRDRLTSISMYDLDGEINSVIKYLQKIKTDYGENISLDYTNSEYGDTKVFAVIREREENEQEKTKRLEQESQSREWRRRNYESLKKEFEKE